MESKTSNVEKMKMFFFPYIAGGHLLPLIDIARFFASSHPHVQATIITTPKTAQIFQQSIIHDRNAGHDISFHTMDLPVEVDAENFLNKTSNDQRIKVVTAFMSLREPLLDLLREHHPDCFVSDLLLSWSCDVAKEANVPWIVFHSNSLFTLCAEYCLAKFKPYRDMGSDTEQFELDGFPYNVRFTRLMLPDWFRSEVDGFVPINMIRKMTVKSFGVIVNSCDYLEGQSRLYCENNAVGNKIWMVGPVNLCSNRNKGDLNVQDDNEESKSVIEWLDSKEQHSVVYVSFGSEAKLAKEQFHELCHGLEASGHPFIWVARPNVFRDQGEEGWFPDGFEDKMRESNQGLLIKGWAPQLLILAHRNVGAFLTHCGFNSCLESLSNGVPMVTWPLTLDQFYNESLVVDVLEVGIRVGNEEWMSSNAKQKVTVTRDRVEVALKRICGVEFQRVRERVQQCAVKCKEAVQEGGSSYRDVLALVEELKAHKMRLN